MKKGTNLLLIVLLFSAHTILGQNTIQGTVEDAETGEPLIGANVIITGTTEGATTDWDGSFKIKTSQAYPIQIQISFIGYREFSYSIGDDNPVTLKLEADEQILEVIEVKGSRISDRQKEAPLTVESLDVIAIKETPGVSFYEGLGSLKGVDLTTASLGFTIINTRGFNSTSPVRSLQLIDGVDNQAPGLNFSLGNFLGASDLDVLKVDLIAGASTAFFGPNAFNGVIDMKTKDPFYHKGLTASIKAGERNLFQGAFRYADVIQNDAGIDKFGYKISFMYLQANDWEAVNYEPSFQSADGVDNPGRYDAVNIYGDENINSGRDYSDPTEKIQFPGLNTFYRQGYREEDLVDYNTENIKAALGLYYRLNPETTLSGNLSYGQGTTVYQGDNRFSLKGIKFGQAKIELAKNDRYFIRAYMTTEDAGQSYDAYFTALRLLELSKIDRFWNIDYATYWQTQIAPRVRALEGYPTSFPFDFEQQEKVLAENQDLLFEWHQETLEAANQPGLRPGEPYIEPGTERFDEAFGEITSNLPSDSLNPGTRFYDKSDLYHIQGEYKFKPVFGEIIVGGNFRLYTPDSRGTIFMDTMGRKIQTWEAGIYGGLEKKFVENKLKVNLTARVDKHQNFDVQISPAVSFVYAPNLNNVFRLSFSSAIRNPTLSDQYLFFNVGRATLIGNLNGFTDLNTINSVRRFSSSRKPQDLVFFDIAPIQPEKVKTVEVGYRATMFEKLWLDANFYYSMYDDFIGYNIGVDLEYDELTKLITKSNVLRVAANAKNRVTTQGFSIGLNYFLDNYLALSGNYSWNVLNKKGTDDPIIPAFNTPENKFNLGLSGRNMPVDVGFIKFRSFGFNVNYKWVEGFFFEGSPQFTGPIDTYSLLDAQINWFFSNLNTTLKIGATNLLDNQQVQTYGGPRIGRLAYVSILYEFKKS